MGVEVALADRRHRAAGGEHDRPAGLAGRRTCSEGVGEVDPGRLERGARAAETALVDLHRGEVPVDATEADDVVAEGPDGVLDTEGDGIGAAQYVDGAARAEDSLELGLRPRVEGRLRCEQQRGVLHAR